MASKGCSDYITLAYKPNGAGLACAAGLPSDQGQATLGTTDLLPALKGWQEPIEEIGTTCRITLRVTFFFDGTGNNRDADEPTLKNSNVARLFRAHPQTKEALGLYQWRFHRIHAYLKAINGQPGDTLPNEDALRHAEAGFDQQRKTAQVEVDAVHDDPGWVSAKERMNQAQQTLQTAQLLRMRGLPNDMPAKQAAYNAAKAQADVYEDRYNRARADLDAVPGSGAAKAIQTYDLNLIQGMQYLSKLVKERGTQQLRPHYRMLLETYQAEFAGHGLTDPDILAFFNDYVHDSLAGFAKDVTLPSDPRCFYDGGNGLVRYADNEVPGASPDIEIAQATEPSSHVA